MELLLVGDPIGDDLNAALAQFTELVARESILPPRIRRALSVDDAVRRLRSGSEDPHWIALLEDWPGQIPAADVDRLRRAAPLARVCGALGSWCEGEARSGRPWPGTLRCSWNAWPSRMASEVAGAAIGKATPWSLPATASFDEMLLACDELRPTAPGEHARNGLAPEMPAGGQLLAVVARDREARMALLGEIEARGYRSLALADPGDSHARGAFAADADSLGANGVRRAIAALWDTTPEAVSDAATVSRVLAVVDHAPLVALVGFPRAEDVARSLAAGVSAVIAKPYLLEDVFWRIARLSRQARG